MTHQDDVRAAFTRQIETLTSSPLDAESLGRLLRLVEPEAHWRGLDVGTGPGGVALALADRIAEVHGVDVTPASIAAAREQVAQEGRTNVTFEIADIERLPFEDASFDLVTCRRVGHHLEHLGAALTEMRRVLKRGGRLVLDDRLAPHETTGRLIDRLEHTRDPSHVHCLTMEEWEASLTAAGFVVDVVDRYESRVTWKRFTAAATPEKAEALRELCNTLSDKERASMLEDRAGETWVKQWAAVLSAR